MSASYYIRKLQWDLEDTGKAWIVTDSAGRDRSRSRLANAARRAQLKIRTWSEWDGDDVVIVWAEVVR